MDDGLILILGFFLMVMVGGLSAFGVLFLVHKSKFEKWGTAMDAWAKDVHVEGVETALRLEKQDERLTAIETKLKGAQVYEFKPGAYRRGESGTMIPANRKETVRDRAPIGEPKPDPEPKIDKREYQGLPMEDLSLSPNEVDRGNGAA